MKLPVFTIAIVALLAAECAVPSSDKAESQDNTGNYQLKTLFEGKFYMGTAMNGRQLSGDDPEVVNLIKSHFNAITAENVMKSGPLQPQEGEFNFGPSDAFVEFGEAHSMHIVGHNLIWHSQAPDWFFTDDQGKDVSPELLKQRMETHIKTVVGR
jgi:endo-1,4-beta-xylanase